MQCMIYYNLSQVHWYRVTTAKNDRDQNIPDYCTPLYLIVTSISQLLLN